MATNPFDIGDTGVTTDPAALAEIAKSNAVRAVDPATTQLSAQDAANAAKYDTPLPPNDPASLNGGRQQYGDLYIGPTNWNNLQGKYTPYQLSQATTKDAQGNISWNKNVDINSIPKTAPVTPITPLPGTTPTATDLMNGSSSALNGMTSPVGSPAMEAANMASQQYLSGLQKSIDDIAKAQQETAAREKEAAQAKRDGVTGFFDRMMGSTAEQDLLAKERDRLKMDQTRESLNIIAQRLADESVALNEGLAFEAGRPVRAAAVFGRQAILQSQAVARMGALKATAEVLKGNFDLAEREVERSINALRSDNDRQIEAASTLLNLYDSDLVRLDKDEKDALEYRKDLLQQENERLEKNKGDIFALASSYPNSFVKAGVSFKDTPEQAMQKMLPYLSEYERMEMEEKKAIIAAKNRSNTGGGGSGSTGTETPEEQNLFSEITTFFNDAIADGMSPEEASMAVDQVFANRIDGKKIKETNYRNFVNYITKKAPVAAELTPEEQLVSEGKARWKYDYEKQERIIEEIKDTGESTEKGKNWGDRFNDAKSLVGSKFNDFINMMK